MLNVNEDVVSDSPAVEAKKVKAWQARVESANKAYEKWAERFNTDLLEGYYSGHGHWEEQSDDTYTINLCHSSLEQRMPSLLFHRPNFTIKPREGRVDDLSSTIEDRVKLREDTLNTFLDDPEVGFLTQTKLALKETHYRFGVVEVGYDADIVDNPNAGKPALDKEGSPLLDEDDKEIPQPAQLIAAEQMWVKRIPAANFRAPVHANNVLSRNDWCGYFEWVYITDLKANPNYANTDKLKATGRLRNEVDSEADVDEKDSREERTGMVKVWKIWDIRTRVKYVWVDGKKWFLVNAQPFKTFPLSLIKFYDLMDELYPVPVMYNWTSPQDELNETRTVMKIHRKRANRRYQYVKGKIETEELEKLKSPEDMTMIAVPQLDLIKPIEDAPLDRALFANVPMTKEDMLYVTEVTGEQHGVSEAETATQANIMDVNSRIRQTNARSIVGVWLSEVCYIMLRLIEEKMVLPMWIMKNVDPLSQTAQAEAAQVAQIWTQIKASELGDLKYEVSVDVNSLSPVTEEQEGQKFFSALGLVMQPGMALLLSSSPTLFKRTMKYIGIKSGPELVDIGNAMQVLALAQATGMAGGGKAPAEKKSGAPGGDGTASAGAAGPPTSAQMQTATPGVVN